MTGRLGTTLFNQTHVISIQHLPSTPSTLSIQYSIYTLSTISTPNTDSTLSLYYIYIICNCILIYISNLSVAPVSCFNMTETRNNFLSQTFLVAARQRREERREKVSQWTCYFIGTLLPFINTKKDPASTSHPQSRPPNDGKWKGRTVIIFVTDYLINSCITFPSGRAQN